LKEADDGKKAEKRQVDEFKPFCPRKVSFDCEGSSERQTSIAYPSEILADESFRGVDTNPTDEFYKCGYCGAIYIYRGGFSRLIATPDPKTGNYRPFLSIKVDAL
jgi:hypothetical protein